MARRCVKRNTCKAFQGVPIDEQIAAARTCQARGHDTDLNLPLLEQAA